MKENWTQAKKFPKEIKYQYVALILDIPDAHSEYRMRRKKAFDADDDLTALLVWSVDFRSSFRLSSTDADQNQ